MHKYKTGDKSLDKWLNFFYNSSKSPTKYLKLLKKTDKYFLTVTPPFEDEEIILPDNGLLEQDFRSIAFNDSGLLLDEKARIIMALIKNVNLKPWQSKYKEVFMEVLEKSLIDGNYELYGIEFSKAVKLATEKEYIEKSEFMGISLLRGMLIGERYNTNQKEKDLKSQIRVNKIKILLGL